MNTTTTYPYITAADEGDGRIVVRRDGEMIGEVYSVAVPFRGTDSLDDEPTTVYDWYAAPIVTNSDGEREMIELDETFPAHQRAITAVAEATR